MAKKKYSNLVIFYLVLCLIICILLKVFLGLDINTLIPIYIGSFVCLLILDFFYIYIEKKLGIYDGDY